MYVPVLKWKLGEKRALEQLSSEIVDRIIPLIEFQPCDSLENINEIADKFSVELSKVWKSKQPVYLDISNLEESCEDEICYDTNHPITTFIEKIISKTQKCIPVIPFNRLEEYETIVSNESPYFQEGIAIRIRRGAFLDADTSIPKFLNRIAMPLEKTTLIIDVQEVSEDDIPSLVLSIKSILGEINVEKYHRIILIGTGYPTEFPSVFMGSEPYKAVQRTELLLWHVLKEKSTHSNASNVIYGDYCCTNSAPLPQDVSQMRPSAIIRYTLENAWHIWKGKSLMRNGYAQYHELSEKIIASEHYKDQNYSWGDEQIFLCAKRKRGTGNPTTWVQIATNHHITLVAQQFSSPADS